MILVLRPADKVQQTTEYLSQAGYQSFGIGIIEIIAVPEAILALQKSIINRDLQTCVVTSTYAAEQVLEICDALVCDQPSLLAYTKELRFFCVGNSTYRLLSQHFDNVMKGDSQDSEGLLLLPGLQAKEIVKQPIAILKGKRGRTYLKQTLIGRGAIVSEYEVYDRQVKTQQTTQLDIVKAQIDCIIATSNEICDAVFAQYDPTWLLEQTWVVLSKRTKDHISSKGVMNIVIAQGAQDHLLLAAVKNALNR